MKPYYYVYRTDESRGPKIKHATLKDAQTESERLANQHPGSVFEILQCLAITRCTQAATFWMDGEGPENIIEMPRWRILKKGEPIKNGDEVRTSVMEWRPFCPSVHGQPFAGIAPGRRPI